ncbi:unnamed protein product [Closterium sp. Naga37s-1]|nr:unnamed protein product [Closterium sp. Naga37s-1]
MELAEPTEPDDGEVARGRGEAEEAREVAREAGEERDLEREAVREARESAREAAREATREARELGREIREARVVARELREAREATREVREAVGETLAAVTEGGARSTQELLNMIYRAVNPVNPVNLVNPENADDDDSSLDDHGDSGDDSEEEEDEEANNGDMEVMEARAARAARDAAMAEEGEIVMTDEGDMLDDDTDDDDIDEDDDDDDDSDDDSEDEYNEFEDPHYNERRRSVLRVASAIAAAPVDDWSAVKGAQVHEEAKYLVDNACSTYCLPSGVCHHQCCDTLVAGPGPVASTCAAQSSPRDDAAPAPASPSHSHSPSSAPSSSSAPPPPPPFSQEIICTVQRMVTLYSTARREVVAVTSLPSEPYSVDRFGDVVVAGCYGTVCLYLIRRELVKKTAGWTQDGAPERTTASHPAHHHHHHYQPQQPLSRGKGAAGAAAAEEEEEEEEEEERVWFEAAGMVGGFESSLIGSSMCNSVRFGTVGNWVRMLVAHQNGYLYLFTLPPPFQPATARHVGRSDWVFGAQSLEDARQMALEARCRTSQGGLENSEAGKQEGEALRRAVAAGDAATAASGAATAAVTAYGGGSAGLDLSMGAAEGSEGRAASAKAAAVASAAAAAAVPAHYPAGSVPLNVKLNLRDLTTVDMPTSAPVTIRSAPAGGLVRTSARLVNAIGPFPMPLNFALVSPNGEWIAVVGDLAAVCVLDRACGFRVSGMASRRIPVASRSTRGAAHGCQYLAWNPSSSLLAVSSDSLQAVYVWGVSRCEHPLSPPPFSPLPSSPRLSPPPFSPPPLCPLSSLTITPLSFSRPTRCVSRMQHRQPSSEAEEQRQQREVARADGRWVVALEGLPPTAVPHAAADAAARAADAADAATAAAARAANAAEAATAAAARAAASAGAATAAAARAAAAGAGAAPAACGTPAAAGAAAAAAGAAAAAAGAVSAAAGAADAVAGAGRAAGAAAAAAPPARATVRGVVGGVVDAAQDQLRRRLHQLEQLLQRRNQPPVSDVVGLAAYFHPGVLVSTETTVFQYPRMGAWSPASHRLYPKRFKEVVRLLLLGHYSTGQWDYSAAADSHSNQAQSDSRYLWLLPLEVLLQIIEHAATPLSVWISDS